jgi:hypothetical protein
LISIVSVSVVIFITLNACWSTLAERSVKPLCANSAKTAPTADKIICYEKYYQDLPVYLNQTVNGCGMDRRIGIWYATRRYNILDDLAQKFWEFWDSHHNVYALLRKNTFENLRAEGRK